MEATRHLQELGQETINMESLYLSLKIEKTLNQDSFTKDAELTEAESQWKEIKEEYFGFLEFVQNSIYNYKAA